MTCDLIIALGALIRRALASLFAMEAFTFCLLTSTLKVITATGMSRMRAPTFREANLWGIRHASRYRDSNKFLRAVDSQLFHNAIFVIVHG